MGLKALLLLACQLWWQRWHKLLRGPGERRQYLPLLLLRFLLLLCLTALWQCPSLLLLPLLLLPLLLLFIFTPLLIP